MNRDSRDSTRRLHALLAVGIAGAVAAAAWAGGRAWMRPVPGTPEASHATELFRVLHRRGLGRALEALERAARTDSVLLRDGHQIAHALGRQAVRETGGNAAPIAECTRSFASGCYHGVVEAFLQYRPTVDIAELERLCAKAASNERPGPAFECVHGLGHGVLGAARFDAATALGQCDRMHTPAFAASCRSGVFMEAINVAVRDTSAHTHAGQGGATPRRLRLARDDPYAPCDGFSGAYADACWLFQGFVILQAAGFDAPAAFRLCDRAPAGRSGSCYESLGHQLTGLFQRDDEWIAQQCALGRPELAPRCAGGAALALGGADWSGRRAAGFCASVPDAWQRQCYQASLGLLAELAAPDDAAWLCAEAEREVTGLCPTPPRASRHPRL